jgi:hypothetical protein
MSDAPRPRLARGFFFVMPDPFASSRRKITRAKKHLADLNREIEILFARPDMYQPFIEAHPEKPGWTVLKARFIEDLPQEFEEIVGDVIGNLRSALDHAVYAVALTFAVSNDLPKPKIETACFPFARDAAHFENALKGRCASVPPEMYSVFRASKPYGGGNALLWALNTVRGTDEHATLVPAANAAFIGGMEIHGAGGWTMPYRPVLEGIKNEMEICSLAPGSEFHGKLQLAMFVAFGEIGSLAGKNAGEVLDLFVKLVTTVVDRIEAESKRLGIVK